MKYRLTWNEWKDIPLEKKIEFWKASEVDYVKVNTGEDGTMTESANFIPTIIEMIEFLGDEWYGKQTADGLEIQTSGLKRNQLTDYLWNLTKLKLNI